VVGVIADARTESIAQSGVPQIYMDSYQRRAKDLAIFVRGQLDPGAIPAQLREQVQAVNPELPVFGAQTLDDTVSASLSERRFSLEMVALFAVTALLLAGLGIYGVISYIVNERTHEIGIRLALGAEKNSILQMVLRQGLRLAIVGTVAGLLAALIVSHLMARLLYGVRPTDPLTFAAVALLLLVGCPVRLLHSSPPRHSHGPPGRPPPRITRAVLYGRSTGYPELEGCAPTCPGPRTLLCQFSIELHFTTQPPPPCIYPMHPCNLTACPNSPTSKPISPPWLRESSANRSNASA
jgi:ABC-type antimicrobial peptide transport system permease subunit